MYAGTIAVSLSTGNSSFNSHLPSQAMRDLLALWAINWTSGQLPLRPPFEPTTVKHALPYVQLHERRPDGRYFCKVSGTHVVDALGFESTNRYVDEVVLPANLASRVALLNEAIDTRLPIHYWGTLAVPNCEWKAMHRLLLPFIQDRSPCVLSVLKFCSLEELSQVGGPGGEHGILGKQTITEAELLTADFRAKKG